MFITCSWLHFTKTLKIAEPLNKNYLVPAFYDDFLNTFYENLSRILSMKTLPFLCTMYSKQDGVQYYLYKWYLTLKLVQRNLYETLSNNFYESTVDYLL